MKKVALFSATALLLMACGADTERVEEVNVDDVETEEVASVEVEPEEEEVENTEEPEVTEEEPEEEVVEQVEEPVEPEEEVVEQAEEEEEPEVIEESFDEIIEREYGRVALITHDEENKVYELMPVLNDVLNIAQRVNRGDEEALVEWEEVKSGLAKMHNTQVEMIGEDYTLSLMHPTMVDTELLMMFDNQINDIPRNAVYSVGEYIN